MANKFRITFGHGDGKEEFTVLDSRTLDQFADDLAKNGYVVAKRQSYAMGVPTGEYEVALIREAVSRIRISE